MKKTIALLFVAVLLISLMATAFAKPVAKCCYCDGDLISITYSKWEKKTKTELWMLMPMLHTWEERTVTTKCTHGVHTKTETRNDKYFDQNPQPDPIFIPA